MVKRTVVVLSILSLVLLMAGSCFAIGLCGASAASKSTPQVYVPVDCPPYMQSQTIVKKWSAKIVAPYYPTCAAPAPAGRRGFFGRRGPGVYGPLYAAGGGLAAVLGAPFDLLFGGRGGVYGCSRIRGAGGGPCGPFFGPVPRALVRLMPTHGRFFGSVW